jgi:hypothetical protein
MKKLLLTVILAVSAITFGQNKIIHGKDKMTDKEYVITATKLKCLQSDGTSFEISPAFKLKKGELKANGIIVNSTTKSLCSENNVLIFLFEDQSKFQITSFNPYDCSGFSMYMPFEKNMNMFDKKLTAIRLTNGITNETMTYTLTDEDKKYFIEYRELLKKNIFEEN